MGRYTDGLLMDGEHVVYRTRQHPFGRLFDAKIGILAAGLGLATLIVIALSNMQAGTLRDILGWVVLVLIVAGAANIAWVYIRWYQDDYVVTNRRVLKVEGILNKKAADSGLEKINDAILEQSVFGRMFDWGDLRILTAAEEVADDYHMLHHAPTFKKTMMLAKQDIEDELARRITAPLEALNARDVEQDRKEAEARASARAAAPPTVAPPAVAPPAPAPVQKTTEEKLRELAALRDAGLITPEDYEAKKTTILATM
jgi:uncharacterized membrane protein YdbT with pleckstrin-like domain